MITTFAREEAELTWFFGEAEGEIKKDVRSGQSRWEAQLEARSKIQRHRYFFESTANSDGTRRTIVLRGTDLRCGCDVHQDGEEHEGEMQAPEIDTRAVEKERRVRLALTRADFGAQHPAGGSEPWAVQAPPSGVLRLRFREFLRPCRWAFGFSGEAAQRGRPIAACIGVRLTPVRGAGNLAHLVPAAVNAHSSARTTLPVDAWTDRLGARHQVTPGERSLIRQIALECAALELRALGMYRRAISRQPGLRRLAA